MSDVDCQFDVKYKDQISCMLSPDNSNDVKNYYENLIRKRQYCGIEVKDKRFMGKGTFTTEVFGKDDLILKDRMFVASQHHFNKMDCLVCSHCFRYIGSIELQIGRKLFFDHLKSSSKTDDDENTSNVSKQSHSPKNCEITHTNSEKMKLNNDSTYQKSLEALMNGTLILPYSKKFRLPPVISCPGGCEEEHYCSEKCAINDWKIYHSLLCTGLKSTPLKKEALIKFIEHANSTNDVFILAAKVISYTILEYKKRRDNYLKNCPQKRKQKFIFPLLLEAWKPVSMAFKERWWDFVSLPDDVDKNDELSFRNELKNLANHSLNLLREAIFEEEFGQLFSLEIYGNIIGMFELNNLDLVVASPVEDYFLYIDGLNPLEKAKTEKITRPFLDALGDDYADYIHVSGSAFFPLHSCMNHSCCPNAKAFKRDQDRDGQAVILATQYIPKGAEVTISYIDESLPYKDRCLQLADYGFKCKCLRCLSEE
ncbi:Histone-lysine N-methyltransferase ATXR2 [Zostera marina]|uniref:Histone-lysine N-methyltransferase ATXR2 n=1 Tax=Zostera marina TaxID=29655 RepID=A0A0K9NRB9_ZOSMR|nr:Histone-lysine N-methyltransferase ATXR2 [Zostera marina]